jgi:U3 small nucleolar RNA-associated protein 15
LGNVNYQFTSLQDYVRAGCVSSLSSDIVVSGSYDHTVRVWDRRKSASVMNMDHGSPVEDVLLLPNDALLVTAGRSN